MNEVAVPDSTKKATKFGIDVFKDMYFFYFFSHKCTQGYASKGFTYKWWVGDKPTSRKTAGKNVKKIYLKASLRGKC